MTAAQNIPGIIDDLYSGTLDGKAWERAMLGITDLVRGSCCCLFAFRPADGTVLRNETYRFDPVLVENYSLHWATKDPRVPAALSTPVGHPIIETQLMSKRTWQMTEIYNDFLVPIDVPWFFSTWLRKAPDKVVSLSIQGTRRHGPFEDSDSERIQPVIPHLSRALEIKDRLEISEIRADTLARSLDSLTFGVLVLDAGGRVLEASVLAQELLRARNGIHRNPDGTISLNEPAGRQLESWILNGTPPAHNTDGLLLVPRRLARPLSVMVARLPAQHISWIGNDPPSWMLLLFDPDRRYPVSTEMIAQDLGISVRAAEIAALLVAGYDLQQISTRLNISIHTSRTHLKSIFSRTGIRSQAELVQRIARGPASIRR